MGFGGFQVQELKRSLADWSEEQLSAKHCRAGCGGDSLHETSVKKTAYTTSADADTY